MNFQIEPLTRSHDRKGFCSLDDTVDNFLREKALQDQVRDLSRTSVMVKTAESPDSIIGYHTLAFMQIPQEQIPKDRPKIKRGIPVILLGQLGIDKEFQGRGLGDQMLLDAQRRVFDIAIKVGVRAMILDSRNEQLAAWYERHAFVRFPESLRMTKRITAIRNIFE